MHFSLPEHLDDCSKYQSPIYKQNGAGAALFLGAYWIRASVVFIVAFRHTHTESAVKRKPDTGVSDHKFRPQLDHLWNN